MYIKALYKLVLVSIVLLVTFLGTSSVLSDTSNQAIGSPLFRIIGIEVEYGQLIVEVQHFNPDGSPWFFEHYTFQGREGLNSNGLGEGPTNINLDEGSILSVVDSIDKDRRDTGWTTGQQRLTTTPLQFNNKDFVGAPLLKGRFKDLVGKSFKRDIKNPQGLDNYSGYIAPADMTVGPESGTVSTFYPSPHPGTTTLDGVAWAYPDSGEFYAGADEDFATYNFYGDGINDVRNFRYQRLTSPNRVYSSYGRWENVTIDPTSTVTDARILFKAANGTSTCCYLDGYLTTDAPAITDLTGWNAMTGLLTDISNRAAINPVVLFDGGTGVGPDMSALVQEIFDDTSFVSGNHLGIRFYGTFGCCPFSISGYDKITDPDGIGSRLHIEWTDGTLGDTWANITGDPGNWADSYNVTATVGLFATATTNRWKKLSRGFFTFDTSAISDTDVITSGTLEFIAEGKSDLTDTQSLSMTTSNAITANELVGGDFDSFGVTKLATDLTIASITADSATLNVFTLNASGRAGIDLTGVTELGVRITSDVDASEPTWVSGESAYVDITTSDELLPGDLRPKLVLVHEPSGPLISGTIGGGATEYEVRQSGTVIITVIDDTWVAAGGTFDAQRQNIIDGLDSAQTETRGWNNEVRDKIGVGSVVRTNSTVATITILSAEVTGYNITANEFITVTVPGSALTGGSPDTGVPVIEISDLAESVAVSGTLGADGGVPGQIVAGGETIIFTLTNADWVPIASFDAQRQAIINGMDSDSVEVNGWDARIGDFPVTDVVRTSDTIVTVTLTASAGFDISEDETITATVPASALDYPLALLGVPTFTILGSGNTGSWSSQGFDLSSITDVAFCSLNWNAILPINTTIVVNTSINGGIDYNPVNNGQCPTGIAFDGSLVLITDFRVQVVLSTTDVLVSPTLSELGFIIQDESGLDLDYQLLGAPTSQLLDNTINTNNSTDMSFPDVDDDLLTTTTSGITSLIGSSEVTTSSTGTTPKQVSLTIPGSEEVTGEHFGPGMFGLLSTAADSLGWSTNTLLSVFILFIALVLGIGASQASGSPIVIIIAIGLGMALGVFMGVLGPWVMITFVIISTAMVGIAKST